MKTNALVLFTIFLYSNAAAVSIAEALKQKQIGLIVTSNRKNGDTIYRPSFYADCMQLKFKNLTGSTLTFTEPAGRFFNPKDSSIQRMVLTKTITFVLKPYEQKALPVYAMCTQAHDGAPRKEESFSFGASATGNLLKMVQFIAQYNYQDEMAQSAIWCITDNYSAFSITGTDSAQVAKLRRYVCELKGVKLENEEALSEARTPHFRQLDGHFEFTIAVEHFVDIKVYNDKNELIKTVLDHEKRKAGKYAEQYELKIPVDDDSNPPIVFVRFYLDGRMISDHKYTFARY